MKRFIWAILLLACTAANAQQITTPPPNLHSPGAIGDVSPATGVGVGGNLNLNGASSVGPTSSWLYQNAFVFGSTTTSPNASFNLLQVANSADCLTTICDGLFVNDSMNGARGDHNGIYSQIGLSGSPAAGDTSGHAYVAILGRAFATASAGGTGTTFATGQGALWGLNTTVANGSSATNFLGVFGYEDDMNVALPVAGKYGIAVIQQAGDTAQGQQDDVGILITSTNATPVGWVCGFCFGSPSTTWPLTSTQTMIGAIARSIGGSGSPVANYGLDFRAVTFTTAAIATPGFTVDPSGNVSGLTYSISGTAVLSNPGAATNLASGQNTLLFSPTGVQETAVGVQAMKGVTGIPLTGNSNAAFGFGACPLLQGAAATNTCIGEGAGSSITTASSNTLLGQGAGNNLTTGAGNLIAGQIPAPAANTASWGSFGNIIEGNLFAKHHYWGGNAPTPACNAGTPTVDGSASDSSGTLTPGAASSSCTVTFASAYGSFSRTTHCIVTPETTLAAFAYSYTNSVLTITATALSGKIDYMCDGG